MNYVSRFLEKKIEESVGTFGAVLVTGPRQAGKTSLLSHLAGKLFPGAIKEISFDTPSEIGMFRRIFSFPLGLLLNGPRQLRSISDHRLALEGNWDGLLKE
jgi:hypothetical protein